MARWSRLAIGLLTLAVAGSAALPAAASAPAVKDTSGPLSATMTPSTHTPKVNAKWPMTVTATLAGKPAHATAEYQFLFAGAVVGTEYPRYDKHFSFTGHFSDTLVFPPSSTGEPLTLQVVIKASGHTVNLDWKITSHK